MASLTSGSRVKSTVSDAGSVQLLSHVRLFVTPWTAACQASLSKLPEFTQTHVHRVGDAIHPSHPLSSTSSTFNLSQHQVISGDGGGLVAKSCRTLATPWTVACQAPLSMGFSRQEYWSRLPFPSPRDLPDLGIKLLSAASLSLLHWKADFRKGAQSQQVEAKMSSCPGGVHSGPKAQPPLWLSRC